MAQLTSGHNVSVHFQLQISKISSFPLTWWWHLTISINLVGTVFNFFEPSVNYFLKTDFWSDGRTTWSQNYLESKLTFAYVYLRKWTFEVMDPKNTSMFLQFLLCIIINHLKCQGQTTKWQACIRSSIKSISPDTTKRCKVVKRRTWPHLLVLSTTDIRLLEVARFFFDYYTYHL